MTDHTPRSFRPVVDFISAIGFGRTGVERERLALSGSGPRLLLSPLGVFDFAPDSHEMRVRSLHPGQTLSEVQERTGFTLLASSAAPRQTEPPTRVELELLRTCVDVTAVLRDASAVPL
jgi:glutaconate CoA-transferase subunit B